MSVSRKALCAGYALIGVLALAGTWGNVLGVVPQSGFLEGNIRFWQDTLANEASRFITLDVLFLGLTVIVWMLLEAREPGRWAHFVHKSGNLWFRSINIGGHPWSPDKGCRGRFLPCWEPITSRDDCV